jgi:hypothetical protein
METMSTQTQPAPITELATETITIRLPRTLVAWLDAYAAERVQRAPGATFSRNRVIRYLLEQAKRGEGQP